MNNDIFGMKLSKNEYFKSELCSQRTKRLIVAGWVAFAVLAITSVFFFVGIFGFFNFLNSIDFSAGIYEIIDQIEAVAGESLGIDPAVFAEFENLEIPVNEILKWSFYVAAVYIAVSIIAMLALSLVAMCKKSYGFAIAALVCALLSGAGFIAFICSVVILVFLCLAVNDYSIYVKGNASAFNTPYNNGNNEPDFS